VKLSIAISTGLSLVILNACGQYKTDADGSKLASGADASFIANCQLPVPLDIGTNDPRVNASDYNYGRANRVELYDALFDKASKSTDSSGQVLANGSYRLRFVEIITQEPFDTLGTHAIKTGFIGAMTNFGFGLGSDVMSGFQISGANQNDGSTFVYTTTIANGSRNSNVIKVAIKDRKIISLSLTMGVIQNSVLTGESENLCLQSAKVRQVSYEVDGAF
jgi:hypothetical protein